MRRHEGKGMIRGLMLGLRAGRNFAAAASALLPAAAAADWRLNLPEGVTPISREIYDLHMTILGICMLIASIVYGVMIFSFIRYRRSRGAHPAAFDSNPILENIWTVIPFLILVGMAIPSTGTLFAMYDYAHSDVTVKVTGYQWKWRYQYLDQGIEFFSQLSTPPAQLEGKVKKDAWYLLEVDKPLVLPVAKKVRLLVTSQDVIHSWWVPDLGIKRDAIPGYVHESWARIEKPGTYRGQCAELCGVHHGFMPIVVEAVSEERFAQWVAQQTAAAAEVPWTPETVMITGKRAYDENCAACHQADGGGIPPLYPALNRSSVTVGAPVSRHIDIVLHGVPGSAMQAFAPQLRDADLAAIISYERNAWGNDTGDLVTPEQVRAQRLRGPSGDEGTRP